MKDTVRPRGRRLLAASVVALFAIGGVAAAGGAAHAASTPVAGPVTEQNGSLTIQKHVNPGFAGIVQNPDGSQGIGGQPLNGATFQLCRIDGMDFAEMLAQGNDYWAELRGLGDLAPALAHDASEIGERDLLDCESETTETVDGVDGIATFDGLPVGAYLVRETAAPENIVTRAAPFVVSIPTPATGADAGMWLYDVHVYPKNQELDAPGKTIGDQGVNVITGAPITYTVSQVLPGLADGEEYTEVVITDELDPRLEPGEDDVVVARNGDDLDIDVDYTAVWDGRTLTVMFLQDGLDALEAGDEVTVTFVATAKANGVITNTAVVNVNDLTTDGRRTPEVVTRWGAVDLVKHNANGGRSAGLAGAEFELWMGQTAGAGCATAATGNVKVADLVSGADGELGRNIGGTVTALPGLWVGDTSSTAADLESRCYFVVETKAPTGFVLPPTEAERTTEFIVHPTEDAHLEATRSIPNSIQTVPELPLTGGVMQIGLTVIGAVMIGTALVLIVIHRRRIAKR